VGRNGFTLKGGLMKKPVIILCTLVAVIFFQAQVKAAQTSPPTKIAVVDFEKFQKNSQSFQRTAAEVRKKYDDLQKKLNQERDSLAKLEDEFRKQSMMLSLDAQEDKRRELEKKQRQYKYLFDESNQEMKDIEADSMKKIMQDVQKIVAKIGEKEGYFLILEKKTPGLVYYNPAIDITDRVTEAYDKSKQ
jgi:outer membrane protein